MTGRAWAISACAAVLALPSATSAAEPVPAAVEEEGGLTGFHGGGGLFVLPAWWTIPGASFSEWGAWIGGGGFGYVWRDSLRIGGMGAEAFLGSEDGTQFRLNYGGIFADWVFHPLDWLEVPLGVELGFGSGRLDVAVGAIPPPTGAHEGAVMVERTSGFVFLVTPVVGVGFIPWTWLKIAIVGRFSYGLWLPDACWGGGAGVSIFFGRFRAE